MRLRPLALLGAVAALAPAAHAGWGLAPKRFNKQGFVDAGALGLGNISGALVAWGHYNDDRFLDAFVMNAERTAVAIHEWVHAEFAFAPAPAAVLELPSDLRVVNVVPADFTYDGRLDVLVMAEPVARTPTTAPLTMLLWPSTPDGLGTPQMLPGAAIAQPLTLDATGDLQTDLLGHAAAHAGSGAPPLSVWRNEFARNGTFALDAPQLFYDAPVPACQLAAPHSSAFVDLNGDCLADLFLVCATQDPAQYTYQIWTARKDGALQYYLAQTGDLPRNAGPLSFADMNRDGTIDVVFSTCERGRCAVHIAYNEQMPLCSEGAPWRTPADGGADGAPPTCRDPLQLCVADDAFRLNLTVAADNARLQSYDVEALTGDAQLVQRDELAPHVLPVPIRLGDTNLDGYPDMLLLTVPRGARPGETRVRLLESHACTRRSTAPGCNGAPRAARRRTFALVRPTVLDAYTYVRSAAFVDLDEDGTLDIVLQSLEGVQLRGSAARDVAFVQNNDFHDAFFLKALTLNAACRGRCEPRGARAYEPWGAGLGGASYKFTVLDPNGVRRAQQVGQQPQTAYGALQAPAAFFGLGRTNNYVESLFVGSTRRQAQPYLVLEGVIPNSEVVVAPWQAEAPTPATWHRELFLHPADWIPLVTAALVGVIGLLGAIVFALDLAEKREDERERRRAVHAINFDAL
ncbi:hypothetical protein MOBT1_002815 [Malassezia obtusa]|uniref:T-cell immunomodulatory protein TIP C2 domain-containing protein n=1 Tax=Malassezia obtusa TaxID=76774 RepID=A0AAF0IT02_9BASI|nr:hypothetical protein MOBT1_002815 [Malassezia obtusa]